MTSFNQIGNRICIIGNSSAGKSTLAETFAERLHIQVLHLDQTAP